MNVTDALGRALTIPFPPKRIVSLVPSLTELLADLGLDEQVVGLTTFCVHPAGWRESKPRLGGTKDTRIPKVLALEPDLVLANKEENTQEIVAALEAEVPVYVTDIATVPEATAAIRALGEVLDRAASANGIADRIDAGFADLPPFPPLRAAYLIWREPWMVAGSDTFIDDVLQRAGFVNVFADEPRYPEATLVDLRAAKPDVLLLSSEPYPFKEKHLAELRDAVPDAAPHLVDGELFSWYGSRLLHTPEYLRTLRDGLST